MKIYDCFIFNNEINLLDFRLRTYWDKVDAFVIAESTIAFDGSEKPLNAANYIERNFPNSGKIILVEYFPTDEILKELPRDRWPIEKFARQTLARGFAEAADDDIIIISDVDEFPSFEQISNGLNLKTIRSLKTPMFFRKANYLVGHSKHWRRIRIGPKYLMSDLNSIRGSHYTLAKGLPGLHLSYLELSELDVIEKHKTSAHSEISVGEEFLKEALRIGDSYGVDHLGRFETVNFGLLKILKQSELNDFQKLFHLHSPQYFNFKKVNVSIFRRISASMHLTTAWKNSDISELQNVDALVSVNILRDCLLAVEVFTVLVLKLVFHKVRNLYRPKKR